MSKKTLAVVIGAALMVVTAWTATAWAVNGISQATTGVPLSAAASAPTASAGETPGSPVPVGPGAPWMTLDGTSSVSPTATPFGHVVRMLAHLAHGAEATDTPFGHKISEMARIRNGQCTAVSVPAAVLEPRHSEPKVVRLAPSPVAGPTGGSPTSVDHAPVVTPGPRPSHGSETTAHSGGMMGPHH